MKQCFYISLLDDRAELLRVVPILPRSGLKAVLILLSIIGVSEQLQAKEIFFKPSVNVKAEYNDNIRLNTDESFKGIDKSAYGVISTAKADLGARSDTYDVAFNNRFVFKRYSSEFDLDSEDYYMDFISSYNLTERNTFGLSANYTRDTTLTSELADTGTGLVQDNTVRQQWNISPNWTFLLSDTQLIQASYYHADIDYEESERGSFVDYTLDNISLNYRHIWTELFTSTASVSAMLFEVPEIGGGFSTSSRETTEYTVNIGFEYQIAPTWFTSMSVGQRFTTTEITQQFRLPPNFEQILSETTISDDVQALVFALNLNKQFESGNASLGYSRSTNAQGNGRLDVRDNLTAKYNHGLSETLKFSLSASFNTTSGSGSQDSNRSNRTYYNIRPSIRWALDRQASLSGGYQYSMQEFDRSGDSGDSNSIFINFNYQWDKLSTQKY